MRLLAVCSLSAFAFCATNEWPGAWSSAWACPSAPPACRGLHARQIILPRSRAARLAHRDGEMALSHAGMEAVARRPEGGQAGRHACRMIGFASKKKPRRRAARQHHNEVSGRPVPCGNEAAHCGVTINDRSAEPALVITQRLQRDTIMAPRELRLATLAPRPANQRF